MRQPTAVYTFTASMDLRDELQDVRAFVSEREHLPASQSEVIRAALHIGLAVLRKQRDANVSKPGVKTPDPYDGPLPPGFVRKGKNA